MSKAIRRIISSRLIFKSEENMEAKKGIIAILTGGGDVPGLNPAIRAVTIRANREGYKVIGLRRGWAGISELIRDTKADNSNNFQILISELIRDTKADNSNNFQIL